MKKYKVMVSIVIALFLVVELLGNNTKVDAQTLYSSGYSRAYSVVYSGLVANHCIADITGFFDDEVSFVLSSSIAAEYDDDDWIEDSIDFMEYDLTINQSSSSDLFNEEAAKASAIAYSMECANWSVNSGRGTDFEDECIYMFLSHYVDRADYYWANQDYSYLNDGPSMSENTSYFSKWIVDDDRTVYDTYLSNNAVIGAANSVRGVYDGLSTVYTGTCDDIEITTAFERASNSAQNLYIIADSYLVTDSMVEDFASGVSYIVDTIASNDAETSLEYMYDQFIEDDGLFHISNDTVREQFISNTVSLVANIIISEALGGSLASDLISDFQYDAYMDIFSLAVYVNMRSSFHGREAQRYYDYLMNWYL